LRIPKKEEVASIAPIGFRLTKGESDYSFFDPQPWLKVLPPTYAPRRLYKEETFAEELIPITRYGFLPLFAPHPPIPRGFKAFKTDGKKLEFEGKEVDIEGMEGVVARETEGMPFASPNSCLVARREGKGYKILLLHPEERGPEDVEAFLVQRVAKGGLALRDIFTGERFQAGGGAAKVPLSGRQTFRILRAEG